MPSLRPPLALVAALLACAAPAQAAGGEGPGALKKQADETPDVVAAPSQPAPAQPPAAPAPAAKPESRAPDKLPDTKGAQKRVSSQAPSVDAGAGADAQRAGTRVRRTTTTRAARRSAARATRRASSRSSARARARGDRDRRGALAPGRAQASPATGEGSTAASRARDDRRERRAASRAAPRREAADQQPSGLGRIEHAAEAVVEVIPGTVVLALAGMGALVLMLIARSWLMERRRSAALAASYGVTVEALATAIEAKDRTTGGHIERVRRLGLLLAREVAPREARDPQMAYGFLLHDIGKLAVPDAILCAPGRLTEEQWELMRRHPEEGVRMLAHVPFLDRALDVVRHHHERWDGSGYPAGLRGEEIPIWARIFSVADALDAMTAERPYCVRRSYADAIDEIRANAGTQFDPQVVAALERLDPALVESLLEPWPGSEREPLAELPEPVSPPLVPA